MVDDASVRGLLDEDKRELGMLRVRVSRGGLGGRALGKRCLVRPPQMIKAIEARPSAT